MTDILIFIITILLNNSHILMVHIILSSKNKLSTINIPFLQNNCFNNWGVIRLSTLQNLSLLLYYKKFIIM